MFPATCSDCGKETQVPFQPRGDRPVYCSDCFAAQRGGGYAPSGGRGGRW
jgi:CxxC-x17-CxxC domain-containing protein